MKRVLSCVESEKLLKKKSDMKMMVACFTQKARFRGHDEVRLGDEEGEQYKLYLHRGAFEPALSDEDRELDPDRWCSYRACGQECWQLIAQWVWNLRLELGHVLTPEPVRTTEFAPPLSAEAAQRRGVGYSEPVSAASWKAGRFTGKDFALQPDGSLRLVYEARIADCRACPLREQCQWHGKQAKHPRRVSLLLHPRKGGLASLLWRDWPRREHRQACIKLLQQQRVEVYFPEGFPPEKIGPLAVLTRAQRAHSRLDRKTRLLRNAWRPGAAPPTMILHGVPDHFALFLGLQTA